MKNFKCDAKLIRLAQSCEPDSKNSRFQGKIRFQKDGYIVAISGPTASITKTENPPEKDITISINEKINKKEKTVYFNFELMLCEVVCKKGKKKYIEFQYHEESYCDWKSLICTKDMHQDYSYSIDARFFSLVSIFSSEINRPVPINIEANGASAWKFKPVTDHWPEGTMIVIMPMRK